MNIGVVDDNEKICQIIKAYVELQGYTAFTYTDPIDFAACLIPHNTRQLDYVIIDVHLPGSLSGVELLRHVRMHHPHLPAILISASPIPQIIVQGLRGVSIHLKPFSLAKLLQTIRETKGS